MLIQLHPQTTLAELSDSFTKVFPYLKLEFYSKPHHAFEGSPAQYLLEKHDTRLSELNPDFAAGELPLHPTLLVRDLEKLLMEKFGLFAQVFRHSGQTWLVTTTTDQLTLAEQNTLGLEASNRPVTVIEPPDYREQD